MAGPGRRERTDGEKGWSTGPRRPRRPHPRGVRGRARQWRRRRARRTRRRRRGARRSKRSDPAVRACGRALDQPARRLRRSDAGGACPPSGESRSFRRPREYLKPEKAEGGFAPVRASGRSLLWRRSRRERAEPRSRPRSGDLSCGEIEARTGRAPRSRSAQRRIPLLERSRLRTVRRPGSRRASGDLSCGEIAARTGGAPAKAGPAQRGDLSCGEIGGADTGGAPAAGPRSRDLSVEEIELGGAPGARSAAGVPLCPVGRGAGSEAPRGAPHRPGRARAASGASGISLSRIGGGGCAGGARSGRGRPSVGHRCGCSACPR